MDIRAAQLRAGDLNHQITITAPAGTVAVTAQTLGTGVPMQISAIDLSQQKEYLALGGLQGSAAYRVRCRYRDDIRLDSVLTEECHGQRVLQILSLVPTELNEGLDMICVLQPVLA